MDLAPTTMQLDIVNDQILDPSAWQRGACLCMDMPGSDRRAGGYHLCISVKLVDTEDISSDGGSGSGGGAPRLARADNAGASPAFALAVTLLPCMDPDDSQYDSGAEVPDACGVLLLRVAAPGGGGRVLAVACAPVCEESGPLVQVPLAELEDALGACDGAQFVATVCARVECDAGLDSTALFRAGAGPAACAGPGGTGALALRGMLDDPSFADATLRAAGREWRTHRVVLAAASPVLAAMLAGGAGGMREAAAAEVCIGDVTSPEAVDLLLRHIYGHDIAVPLAHVPALHGLAQRYMLSSELAPQLLAHLMASQPSPAALAVLVPAALEACPLACEESLFRQASEASEELSEDPAWLEGAQFATVAGVMAHLPPHKALAMAGSWVAAGGAAEGGHNDGGGGSVGSEDGSDPAGGQRPAACSASGDGTGPLAKPSAAVQPSSELARAGHWPALLRALRWRDAGRMSLTKLAELLRDQGSVPQGAPGCWGMAPHLAGLQAEVISHYQAHCEKLALQACAMSAELNKRGQEVEGLQQELLRAQVHLSSAQASASALKRSAQDADLCADAARSERDEAQKAARALRGQLDAAAAARDAATERASDADARLETARGNAEAAQRDGARQASMQIAAMGAAVAQASDAVTLAARRNKQLAAQVGHLQRALDEAHVRTAAEQQAAAFLREQVAQLNGTRPATARVGCAVQETRLPPPPPLPPRRALQSRYDFHANSARW